MHSISRFGAWIALLSLAVSVTASSQQPSASSADAATPPAPRAYQVSQGVGGALDCSAASLSSADVEVCKLRLQRDQYRLDLQKLDDQQAASTQTTVALVLSALVGFGTIVFNLVMANRQARLQAQLKAFEVVMSASGPNSARQRLDAVERLLGTGLVPSGEKQIVIEGVGTGHDESRRTLLKLLAEHPGQRRDILADWATVFRDTKLSPNIEALQKPPSTDTDFSSEVMRD